MKPLFIIAVIAGLIVLCGVGNLPCFADSGAGISIPTTITVTGGSGWQGWGSNTNFYKYNDEQPKKPSPYMPQVTNFPPPVPPTYPNASPPQVTPAIGQPLPQESNFNWAWIPIILGGVLFLFIAIWVLNQRNKAKQKKIGQQPPQSSLQPPQEVR